MVKTRLRRDETVFFFGAGASASFGYPVTREIFPRIWEDIHREAEDDSKPAKARATDTDITEQFDGCEFTKQLIHRSNVDLAEVRSDWRQKLRQGLIHLMPGLGKPGNPLPSIIEVLSIVDHFLASRAIAAPIFQYRFLQELRTRLELATLHALRPNELPEESEAHQALSSFASWLLKGSGTNTATTGAATIISTNYDFLVESLLFHDQGLDRKRAYDHVDFGFQWRDPGNGSIRKQPNAPMLRLFKLHGSLNWLRCGLCGYIYVQNIGPNYQLAFRSKLSTWNQCHCGHGELRPVIVAPSSAREVSDPNLFCIWQNALEALRTARQWFFVGFSIPPEDLAIRSILMRAYRGRDFSERPKITVVDWKGSDDPISDQFRKEVEGRYRLLFEDVDFRYDGSLGFIKEVIPYIG